jgi:hypothetical protein
LYKFLLYDFFHFYAFQRASLTQFVHLSVTAKIMIQI